jgi:hypothetical protein
MWLLEFGMYGIQKERGFDNLLFTQEVKTGSSSFHLKVNFVLT